MADDNEAPADEGIGGWDVSGEIKVGDGVESLDTPPEPVIESTPLEEDEPEGVIPPAPLWAMKDRRHFFGLPGHGDAERIRTFVGQGDSAVYLIDDGRSHCMVGRRVGVAPDGSIYCLVGRVTLERYLQILNGEASTAEAFSEAHDVALCSVFEDESMVSEVTLVRHFRHPDDVPADYLPPSPFIEFTEDLPTEG